jgi:hypothetical protein
MKRTTLPTSAALATAEFCLPTLRLRPNRAGGLAPAPDFPQPPPTSTHQQPICYWNRPLLRCTGANNPHRVA